MILEGIVAAVRAQLAVRMRHTPQPELERRAAGLAPCRGFAAQLRRAPGGIGLIAELKRASPSAGLLRADFEPERLARELQGGGADCLSVLTERDHFQGELEFLQHAARCGLPCLQKDFVVHPYQIFEARVAGADAVLLIAEVLSREEARQLCKLARALGLDVLYEAHAGDNIAHVVHQAAADPEHVVAGINNRNLADFTVDVQATLQALATLSSDVVIVSESGIHTSAQVRHLRDAGARGILVGEALMRRTDVRAAARELMQAVRATVH